MENIFLSGIQLTDENVENLMQSFKNNTTFNGGIYLSDNLLTDQAGLAIAELLKTNNRIHTLSLSNNPKISYKTAVFISEALKSYPKSYPITNLEFAGIDLEELGIRQLCELLTANNEIKMIVLGKIDDLSLKLLGENISKFPGVQTIRFEESDKSKWSQDSMNIFIQGLKASDVVLDVKVDLIEQSSWKQEGSILGKLLKTEKFVKEIQYYAEMNRKKNQSKQKIHEWNEKQGADKEFEYIM